MNALKSTILEALNILPVRVKNSLLHLSFNIARPEFDRFSHLYAYAPNMEMGLSALAARGMRPKTVVDVGAFEGNWSKMARRIWPDCKIIMFEPNPAKLDMLSTAANSLGADLHTDLLGAEEGTEVIFNIMESGSSVMNERSPVIRTQETRTLRRIENVIPKLESPAFLKIDVQGYELEILKGAMNILDFTEAILLEVSIIEINEGSPLLAEVTSFMKAIGFIACEILEIHRRPLDLALNQIDIVFLREDSQLFADKRHFA